MNDGASTISLSQAAVSTLLPSQSNEAKPHRLLLLNGVHQLLMQVGIVLIPLSLARNHEVNPTFAQRGF